MEENEKYLVCTICSSSKYKDKIIDVASKLEQVGVITLKPDLYSHADGIDLTEDNINMLDEMHRQKIDMANFVIVIDDHIGKSVSNEIDYSNSLGLIVLYWSNINEKIDSLITDNKILSKYDIEQCELDQIRKFYMSDNRDPNKQPLCTIVHNNNSSTEEMVYKIKEALTFSGVAYFELFPRTGAEYSDAHTKAITKSRFYESICIRLRSSDYIIIITEDSSDTFSERIESLYRNIDKNAKIFICNNSITLGAICCCAKCGMILTYDLLKRAMSDPRQDSELFSPPSGYYTTNNKCVEEANIVTEIDGEEKILGTIETESNPETYAEDHDDCCGQ